MGKKEKTNWADLDDELKAKAERLTSDAVEALSNCDDPAEALDFAGDLKTAAAIGCPDAQFYLAEMYRQGIAMPSSSKDAYPLYLSAAKSGHAEAMLHVAWYCYCGSAGVVEENEERAFKWLERSAEAGCTVAQSMFAVYLRNGESIPQDHEKAIWYFGLSAAKGDRLSLRALDAYDETLHQDREPNYEAFEPYDDGLNDLTTMDLVKRRLNRTKFLKTFFLSYDERCALGCAQYKVGAAYAEGETVEKDMKKAAGWFKKAAENGNSDGECAYARCLHEGAGVERDDDAAFEWMKRATDWNKYAMYELAKYYRDGVGVEASDEEYFKHLLRAAEWYVAAAMRDLANCYENGVGTEVDVVEAEKWIEKAEREEGEA